MGGDQSGASQSKTLKLWLKNRNNEIKDTKTFYNNYQIIIIITTTTKCSAVVKLSQAGNVSLEDCINQLILQQSS